MGQHIDYAHLMHHAMRGLIYEVLQDVAENGLPGDHHFFITFESAYPGVDLPEWLRERYPDEMTVVLQHEYEDLAVDASGFSVTLSFGETPVSMTIPFDSLRTFIDPSVEFGLRFETPELSLADGEDGTDDGLGEQDDALAPFPERIAQADEESDESASQDSQEPPSQQEADVVSLDSFRKP